MRSQKQLCENWNVTAPFRYSSEARKTSKKDARDNSRASAETQLKKSF
jgi:hypothetical protein